MEKWKESTGKRDIKKIDMASDWVKRRKDREK